ncbi:hypothetical protein FGB62_242g017 [Gracilaria domingensis]|nr:hypothetical protein FGB62_242g017 [Gracilaria domingensis]
MNIINLVSDDDDNLSESNAEQTLRTPKNQRRTQASQEQRTTGGISSTQSVRNVQDDEITPVFEPATYNRKRVRLARDLPDLFTASDTDSERVIRKRRRRLVRRNLLPELSESKETNENESVPTVWQHGETTPVNLDDLLASQEARLSDSFKTAIPNIYRPRTASVSRSSNIDSVEDPKKLWQLMIRVKEQLFSDYFTSEEARLVLPSCQSEQSGDRKHYDGLDVDERNCIDIKKVYEDKYLVKRAIAGAKTTQYSLVKTIAGQVMRWAIVAGVMEKNDGWKEGSLFGLLHNYKLVKCLVRHFSIIYANNTTASKCASLRVLIEYALLDASNQEDEKEMKKLIQCLNQFQASSRTAARKEKYKQRLIDFHEDPRCVVKDAEVRKGYRTAIHVLRDIIKTFHGKCQENLEIFRKLLYNGKRNMAQKWGINLLAAIMLEGGGQRPEAYANLRVPTALELSRITNSEFGSYLSLRTWFEKRPRDFRFPIVMLPAEMKPIIKFHVEVVRPIILVQAEIVEEEVDAEDRRLLLHTQDGNYLTSRLITRSFRAFMCNQDRKFSTITSTNLRSSFATSMVDKFKKKKFTEDLTQDEFLRHLSRRMNTSIEMLKDVYVMILREDYEEGVKIAMKYFSLTVGEGDE